MSSGRTAEPVDVDEQLLAGWPLAGLADGEVGGGSLLIVGGSRVTPGAVLLSALAALRAGAGKVQVLTAQSAAAALAIDVPELLVAGAPETDDGELDPAAAEQARELAQGVDVVLVGPGLMSPRAAVDLCRPLLPTLENRLVVDALSLAFFADRDAGDRRLADGRVVLTPNTGEVALALDVSEDELEDDEDEGAGRLAERHGAVVTAGGATTWIVSPDGRRWVDRAGHPAMGASGSGDSKAGVIAAFLTRTDDPAQAAVWGGAVHALAGERAARRIGPVGYLAREVVDEVPAVIADLCRP
jgi:ADP-dependent NAD(P)H-hydrate dehydratase